MSTLLLEKKTDAVKQLLSPLCEEDKVAIFETLEEIVLIYEDAMSEMESKIEGHLETIEDLETQIEELQEKSNPHDDLIQSVTRYHLGVKSEQENILKILRDTYDLDLVCL